MHSLSISDPESIKIVKQNTYPELKKIISHDDIVLVLKKTEKNLLDPKEIVVKGPVTYKKAALAVLRFYQKKLTKADLKEIKDIRKENEEKRLMKIFDSDNTDALNGIPSKLTYANLVRSSYVLEGFKKSKGFYRPVFGT